MMPLREIMATDLQTTTPEASVAEASATMVDGRVGSALVMTGAVLVGIVTERDVLRAAASGRDLAHESVRNWMTPDPVTSGPDDTVDHATETMLAQGFRHLPVVDGTRTVGMVSLRDLLSARIRRHV